MRCLVDDDNVHIDDGFPDSLTFSPRCSEADVAKYPYHAPDCA